MSAYINQAAWLDGPGKPLRIAEAPIGQLDSHHVLIRVEWTGITPLDMFQSQSGIMVGPMPAILGTELAGIVEEVGTDVQHVKPGQRVLARTCRMLSQDSHDASFQRYSRVHSVGVTPLPDSIKLSDAASLPMSVTTACQGLYAKVNLGLDLPQSGHKGDHARSVIWVQGGSSSVGAMGIQFASQSGYTVVATASPHNAEALKQLGAKAVIDYKQSDAVKQLAAAIKSFGTLKGVLMTAGNQKEGFANEYKAVAALADEVGASSDLLVASSLRPPPFELSFKPRYVRATDLLMDKDQRPIGQYIMNYLGRALASGEIVAAPPARSVGSSLHDIQSAIHQLASQPPSYCKYVVKVGEAEDIVQ